MRNLKGEDLMSAVRVELCPETGICSVVKEDNSKVDLMPDEVAAIREAQGDGTAVKHVFEECDSSFADSLDEVELQAIVSSLR